MLTRDELLSQRAPGADEDVHFTESLATAVINEYSRPGDTVLDPFAGFGTTPLVAARLGRRPVAVELLAERASVIRQRLSGTTPGVRNAEVITGDARRLSSLVSGPIDLCLTSPPYMTSTGHPENPLTGYATKDGDYQTFLYELGSVFGMVATLLCPGGYAVLNVANPISNGSVTPLAWDVAHRVAQHLTLRQDVFLCWDQPPPGLSGDYCLVFQKD
jgi:DNA modification methylase